MTGLLVAFAAALEALFRWGDVWREKRAAGGAELRRYSAGMDDAQIHSRIEQLVAEEHRLWEAEERGGASGEERRRLAELKLSLDQCWDLLRQRRALRDVGRDPEDASVRSEQTVEHYQQ